MTPRPDVSVIIACYNAADTVAETLASVQTQTHTNWEAVCVDDGSSDRTPDALETSAATEPRIRWVRVSHGGQAAAKNRGLTLARADDVLFLDADDILRRDALEVLLRTADAAGQMAIVAGGHELLDSAGQPLSIYRFPTLREFSVGDLLCGNRLSIVTLIAVSLLAERPFDETLETCIDWDLWLRLAHAGVRCVTVPRVTFGYRLHPGSLSRRTDRVFACGRRIIERFRTGDDLDDALAAHSVART